MTTVYVCKVHSKILNETKLEICFYRNKKMYFGPLFWKKSDDPDNRIVRYVKSVEINVSNEEDEDMAVYTTYMHLAEEFGIKTYESTLRTMMHWSYVNGFTDVIHVDTKERC